MVKRLFLSFVLFTLGTGAVFASEAIKEAPANATAAQTSSPEQPQAPSKAASPEDQLRAQLDGTEWTVQLTPSAGVKGATAQKDVITFTKRQVKSSFMEKAGYPASNYSLTFGSDGRAVWETMQTKEGEGVAFWRGELEGATMRGVLSKHPTQGESIDYSLNGQVKGGKAIVVSGAAAAAAGAVSVRPPAASAAPSAVKAGAEPAAAKQPQPSVVPAPGKKKKKGWF